jgi:hypothetical protein
MSLLDARIPQLVAAESRTPDIAQELVCGLRWGLML